MALQYVDAAYFTNTCIYSKGAVITDAGELDRLLERAERDIDSYIGPRSVDSATGRKLVPSGLVSSQQTALKDAVCCQALWRNDATEAEFINSSYESVSGPDFTTSGKRSRISPQARDLLWGAGLVVRTARMV